MGEMERSPLDGKRIVVTRAARESEALSRQLSVLGAIPIVVPLVAFADPDDFITPEPGRVQEKASLPLEHSVAKSARWQRTLFA